MTELVNSAQYPHVAKIVAENLAHSVRLSQMVYRIASISAAAAALRKSGNFPLGPAKPALAFGGAHVQFLWSPLGFVVELIEAPDFQHNFGPFIA